MKILLFSAAGWATDSSVKQTKNNLCFAVNPISSYSIVYRLLPVHTPNSVYFFLAQITFAPRVNHLKRQKWTCVLIELATANKTDIDTWPWKLMYSSHTYTHTKWVTFTLVLFSFEIHKYLKVQIKTIVWRIFLKCIFWPGKRPIAQFVLHYSFLNQLCLRLYSTSN